MSYAAGVKKELARVEPGKKCCELAEISGFLRVAGTIGLAGRGRFKIKITSENPVIIRHYNRLLQDYFAIDTSVEIGESNSIGNKPAYNITIDPENRSEQILRETGILLVKEGNNYISDGIYGGVIRNKCCKRAYLRGIFMGAGTMSDPKKAYHLEFVCHTRTLAGDLKKLLNSFRDLEAKETRRGQNYIVYMKKADYLSDVLGIMEASSHSLELSNTWVEKEVRSHINRMVNCDAANLDRQVDAAMKQKKAIEKIEREKGLDWLPEKLKQAAILRKEHPEAHLKALGEMCNPPLKKSGINGRLKKIEELADKL